jgi:hypothetical protein
MASTTTSSNLCSSGSSRTLAHRPTRSLLKVANNEVTHAAGMLIFQTRFYTASSLRDSCTYLIHQDESRLPVFRTFLEHVAYSWDYQKKCTGSSSKTEQPNSGLSRRLWSGRQKTSYLVMCDRLKARIVSTSTTGSAVFVEPASAFGKENDMSVLLAVAGIINFVQLHLVSQRGRLYWAALTSQQS